VFYDAERVLSAIAKFLVYLLWERERRGKMGDGRGRRKEWEGKRDATEGREMGIHEKISSKATYLACGRPLGGYRPVVSCILEISFHKLNFPRKRMPVYCII